MRAMSSTSSRSAWRCRAAVSDRSTHSSWSSSSAVIDSSSPKPRIDVRGVRSSWLIRERNPLVAERASSSWRLAWASSWERWRRSMTIPSSRRRSTGPLPPARRSLGCPSRSRRSSGRRSPALPSPARRSPALPSPARRSVSPRRSSPSPSPSPRRPISPVTSSTRWMTNATRPSGARTGELTGLQYRASNRPLPAGCSMSYFWTAIVSGWRRDRTRSRDVRRFVTPVASGSSGLSGKTSKTYRPTMRSRSVDVASR